MLAGRLEGLPDSLTELSTTGLLKDQKPAAIEEWIEAAVGGGLLFATDDTYRTLSLTRVGREVMAGRATEVELSLPERPRGRPAKKKRAERWTEIVSGAGEPEPGLFDALKRWRREESSRRGVPAYVVLHDATLEALACARPQSLDALAEIPGIGPAKLAAYGPALLAIVLPR
jgi:ATP-dependent DNA helicase RecQ